jgi:CBS domain-containing protein
VNVAFFLTPKAEVVCVSTRASVRQALEKMEAHRYTAVPLVDHDGRYVGTLTEGDLLWHLKHIDGPWLERSEHVSVMSVPRRMDNRAVRIGAEMEELIQLASDQNFVPVVDDREVFVGIVRRKSIIDYCRAHMVTAAG